MKSRVRGTSLTILITIGIMISLLIIPANVMADAGMNGMPDVMGCDDDYTEWVEEEVDVPTGTAYRLFDDGNWGGFWADAEKDPDPGDNLLCWAATASNMLEWTGWGFAGDMVDGNTDDFFQFFRDHVTDAGTKIYYGIDWWFDGTLQGDFATSSSEDVDHTGFYGDPPYTPDSHDYIYSSWSLVDAMSNIRTQLMAGRAVGLGIYTDGGGAHAITCWGFNYDTDGGTYGPGDTEYYKGIWVSDSDSHKGSWDPDDVLRYVAVDWDSTDNRWEMGSWFIKNVVSLEMYPGSTRPDADAGAAYTGYEGTPITFNAGGSTDDATLRYRWDFDGDGVWDTAWLSSSTVDNTWDDELATGNVYLEVFDNRLRDMDTTTVTVLNVDPVVTVNGDTIDEDGTATVSGTITDPGTDDSFTVVIDWGEGSPESFSYPAGTTSFSETHQYLDDDPTVTPSDSYAINVTVTDDDGGVGTAATTVTVNNVAPFVTSSGYTIDEDGTATVSGTIDDPGTLDSFTVDIDWGDGSIDSFSYPAGTTTYSETHQYLDDNPTGTSSDNYTIQITVTDDDSVVGTSTTTVTVNNVAPVVTATGDTINEDGTATVSGTITDPGTLDTFTVVIDWGEGTPQSFSYPAGTTSFSETHQYLDDNPTGTLSDTYTVTVTVTDDDTGVGTAATTVTVNNVDPVVDTPYISNQPNDEFILPVVHEVEFMAAFSDIGTMDTHTAVWDWGDSSTSTGTVDEISGSGTVTGSHTFAASGDYVITVTVTDDDTGETTSDTFTVHVADLAEALGITNTYIQDLDDEDFKNQADKRKAAIDSMFSALQDMLTDEEYEGMVEDLTNNIRSKMDGFEANSRDDWIIDEAEQEHICQKIDDIVAYLEYLLTS